MIKPSSDANELLTTNNTDSSSSSSFDSSDLGSSSASDTSQTPTPAAGGGGDDGVYKPGDKTKKGREFTGHGAEQANKRGFSDDAIDSIIDNNYKKRVKEIDEKGRVTWRYQDKQ